MTKEYTLPPAEGPVLRGPTQVRIFEEGEIPVEIGSLEREAFSYIGDWNTYLDQQGYGLAYRFGIKEGFTDSEGDLATLVLHFANPVARRGMKMTTEIIQQQYERLKQFVQTFTMQAQQLYGGSILSTNPEPPQWMMKELEEMLS